MGSVEQFSGQTVDEMVGSGTEGVSFHRLFLGTRKTDLEGVHYKTVFRGDELVKCFGLKELELTAVDMLGWKVGRQQVTRYDVTQQGAAASAQRKVKCNEVLSDKGHGRDDASSSDNRSGSGSSRAVERKCERKK